MTKLNVLRVMPTCNTADTALIANLEAAKAAGHYELRLYTGPPSPKQLVICASGPSLKDYLALMPRDGSVDIMALNGAYDVLLDAGIVPDYFAMLDARALNVNFLTRPTSPTVFLLASQVHPECFKAVRERPVCMFHLHTPTTKLVFPDERVYFGGGTTIGLTAMGVVAGMGYRKMLLLGYDSSYDDEGRSHAKHQPQNDSDTKIDVWVRDRRYWSTANLAQQVMDFRPWCKALEHTFPGIEITLAGRGMLYDHIVTGQSEAPTRESEVAKYALAYEMDDYGMPPEREHGIKALLAALPAETADSLLDVGTGRGETLRLAREMNFSIVNGTETVDALLGPDVVRGILPDLPVPGASYDVVTSFEVIEHLLPDDLGPALLELTRIAKHHILISACTQDHWVSGTNLHPSAMPQEEWEALFRSVWGGKVQLVGNLSEHGVSPVWRVDL